MPRLTEWFEKERCPGSPQLIQNDDDPVTKTSADSAVRAGLLLSRTSAVQTKLARSLTLIPAAAIILAGLMISAYGTLYTTLLTGPRVPYALAMDSPRVYGRFKAETCGRLCARWTSGSAGPSHKHANPRL